LPKEVDVIRAARTSNDCLLPLNEIIISNYNPQTFAQTGTASRYMEMPDSPLLTPLSSASKLTFLSSSTSDTTTKVTVWGTDSTLGIDVSEQVTLNGTSNVLTANTYSNILSVTKDTTVGNVTVKQGSTVQGYMMKWEDRSVYRRIRLLPIPSAAATYYFEGVRRFIPLVYDQDTVLLHKAENTVFDLLVAELYEMNSDGGMYERGAVERNKATMKLEGALARENVQEQIDQRSFPQVGMFNADTCSVDTSKTGIWEM
jgi:hypothetical protein